MERANQRLVVVVPLTLAMIFLLLYVHFRNVPETLIVMLGTMPFAPIGGIWLMYLSGFNLSVAVAVGFIALAGLAAETGVVMLVYLDETYERFAHEGRLKGSRISKAAIIEGAVDRVRPKLMTVEHHDDRPAADHVRHRDRHAGHEAHRRADGRRAGLVDAAHPGRAAGDLPALEAVLAAQEARVRRECHERSARDPGNAGQDSAASARRLESECGQEDRLREGWCGADSVDGHRARRGSGSPGHDRRRREPHRPGDHAAGRRPRRGKPLDRRRRDDADRQVREEAAAGDPRLRDRPR